MQLILTPFSWLITVFNDIFNNYGLALILFALLVKVLLFPLSLRGKRSMIQMNGLNAQMQKLQKMYGNNKERYNIEVQKLYEKEKVNPMGGCLWSMLPLFILLPLYAIVREPMTYMMNLTADQVTQLVEVLGVSKTGDAYFQLTAADQLTRNFSAVLSNPAVSCLVISISTLEQVDEYVAASGTALQARDVALLQRYDQLVAGDYCQPHCGRCLDSCLYELPVNDILRYRMYAKDYHWPSEGNRLYAQLTQNAAACSGCAAPCAGTCPIGVPIQAKMLDAHRVLSVTA